ncbi:MAG: ribonuclease H-like domain-containing protein [Candidatus Acetothermia bacterium]|nr:ribonuclease H-like domain-containing protein [Candidatus Acetothermia bacterium]MDH7505060.1 ribonuclease H-like domain-containing protein [Candidatus Acetothermia bacterium]
MSKVVFDIETVGLTWESFDEVQQDYLMKLAEQEETEERRQRKREELFQGLNFAPLTAEIVAIGLLNVETNRGRVYYQSPERESWASPDGAVKFESADERGILERFWEAIRNYDRFITFNGRGFDCPFLMIRSAIHGLKPTRNLMPPRFDARVHCDLLDQLTFYRSVRSFNLDFYCKAFGIESPKGHGITGLDLNRLFAEGKYREIAQYCLGDVVATAELYRRWEPFLFLADGG